jgi:hypothetical protein
VSLPPVTTDAAGVLHWSGGAAVCADGSPRAYKPPPGRGLDLLANAYRDPRERPADPMAPASGWVGVCTVDGKPHGKPIVQGDGDPCPGYLVSPTAGHADPSRPEGDPRRYHDAEATRYIVVPASMLRSHGGALDLGDAATVSYRGKTVDAIVGEVGPGRCEVSIAVARARGTP